MPRVKIAEEQSRPTSSSLVARLSDELKNDCKTGQPTIYEQEFGNGKIRVTVIWDEWDKLPFEDRTNIIMRAYGESEGEDYRERIALASGLTIPEAEAAGMLRFRIIAAVRKDDLVTADECRRAMIDIGASILLDPEKPQLRFATLAEAETAEEELIRRLPKSEPIWVISQDVGSANDWPDL